eukprot:scaffold1022_cov115-Skeletonema_dohrnii-CCMP3373.AAC.6
MGQNVNYAVAKDAQIRSGMEECALDMGQRSNDAVVKDATIMPSKEDCARDMEQRDEIVQQRRMH